MITPVCAVQFLFAGLSDYSRDVSSGTEREEIANLFERFLDPLSAKQRECIVAYYFKRTRPRDIPIKNVYTRIAQAFLRLQFNPKFREISLELERVAVQHGVRVPNGFAPLARELKL